MLCWGGRGTTRHWWPLMLLYLWVRLCTSRTNRCGRDTQARTPLIISLLDVYHRLRYPGSVPRSVVVRLTRIATLIRLEGDHRGHDVLPPSNYLEDRLACGHRCRGWLGRAGHLTFWYDWHLVQFAWPVFTDPEGMSFVRLRRAG